jgi:hypothetical protein
MKKTSSEIKRYSYKSNKIKLNHKLYQCEKIIIGIIIFSTVVYTD